jgi:hypothetical protein
MRPVLIAASLLLLILVSLATGVLAADWPFWQRAWRWHEAAPEWPATLPGAHRRVGRDGMARDLPLDVDAGVTSAVAPLLDDEDTEALLVARDDRVLFEYYGGDADAGARLDGRELSTLPLVPLYGAAAAHGVDLPLDGSVGSVLEAWRNDSRASITPRMLLQRLSGLEARRGSFLNPFGRAARLASGPNFEQAALAFRGAWPPGSHFSPDGPDAQVAATALVRAAHRPLVTLLEQWLVQPLQLDSLRVLLDRRHGAMAVHCCVQARARDWLTLALLVAQHGQLGGERVFSEEFAREIPESSPVAPGRALGLVHVDVGGSVPALLAAGRGRLLLIDADSRTAWLWFSRRDLGPAGLEALRNAAARAAGRQPRP